MKKYILSIFISLLTLPALTQSRQPAKDVLDLTAETFRKAGGVKVDFTIKAVTNGLTGSAEKGSIRLKGEKFVLTAGGVTTWFDGETQWSYVAANDEVNVSCPTMEELQQINPYTFLYIYQQGFSFRLGTRQSFQGKAIQEVILTATDKKQELERITLYVTKDAYEPLYILLKQRGQQTGSEITVTDYQTQQNFADPTFVFNKSLYPSAEIIDLR